MSGDMNGMAQLFGHAQSPSAQSHEVILQALNRPMKSDDGDVWYDAENFVGSEKGWDEVPVIFAQDHPDANLVDSHLEMALKSVKTDKGEPGRLAGYLSESSVESEGQPRLQSKIEFTDKRVNDLYKRGDLSLSTAFFCSTKGGKLKGTVRPNHLLVFVTGSAGGGMFPRDGGAMFLNSRSGGEMAEEEGEEEYQNAGKSISNANAGKLKQAVDLLKTLLGDIGSGTAGDGDIVQKNAEEDEAAAEAARIAQEEKDAMEQEAKEAAEAAAARVVELEAENAVLKAKVDATIQAEADVAWANAKKEYVVDGWLAKEGAEAELRTEFEEKPHEFMNRVFQNRKTDPKGKEGTSAGTNDVDAVISTIADLRMASGRRI